LKISSEKCTKTCGLTCAKRHFRQFIAEDMQELADAPKFVDKDFMPWYKGIVKSKRLHNVDDAGARGSRNAGCGHRNIFQIMIE
jgi:hypothetical protein